MNGGSISENKDRSVLARTGSGGSFTLCGGTISGKIRLEDSVIVIGNKLDESSCYKIEMNTPGVFTSGLNGKGTAANFDSAGKNGYLQVENIAAPNLDTAHSFTITDGTDTYTVTASALSYGYTSVKNGDEARRNLGKALYLYNQAANEMFGN